MDVVAEQTDDRFRFVVDLNPVAMMMVNAAGLIVRVNVAAACLFGYDRDTLIGQSVDILVPASARHQHPMFRADYASDARARPMGSDRDLLAARRDGSEVQVEIGLSPVVVDDAVVVLVSIVDITVRKQMEHALRQYAAIVESADDAIVGKTADGIITSWNAGAERIFGFPRDEAIGRSIAIVMPQPFKHEEEMLLAKIRRGERIHHYETVRQRKDGHLIDVSVSISPIRDQRGTIIGASKIARLIHQDVAERKQFERHRITLIGDLTRLNRDLDDLSTLKSAVLDNAAYAIIAGDADCNITVFNHAAEEMLGYAAAEVIGQSAAIFHDPQEVAARAAELTTELGSPVEADVQGFAPKRRWGREDGREWTYIRKDGSRLPVWVTISALRNKNGLIQGYLGVATDLSERKRSGEALRESEERFRGVFAAAAQGMAIISPTGRILEVNGALCAMLGYGADELLAMDFQVINHPDDLAEGLSMVDELVRGRIENYHLKKRYIHKNGGTVWALLSASLVRKKDRSPLHLVAQIVDVTEQHHAELALRSSQSLLTRVGAAAGVGGWEFDVRSGVSRWSDETFRLHDLEPGPVPGPEQRMGFVTPAARPLIEKAIEDCIARGVAWDFELERLSATGRAFWVRTTGIAEYEGGRVVRIVGSLQDISARRDIERRRNEMIADLTRLNKQIDDLSALEGAVLASAAYAIIAADQTCTITVFNPAAEAMLGYTAAEMIGQTPAAFHDPREVAARASELTAELGYDVAAGTEVFVVKPNMGQQDTREWTYIRKDGSRLTVWLTITTLRDKDGLIIGYLGSAIDLSERKRSEDVLRESEERFRGAFETAAHGMAIVSPTGLFLKVNCALCGILGHSENEILAFDIQTITHPDDLAESLSLLKQLIDGDLGSYNLKKRYIHKNGSILWVHLTVSLVRTKTHSPLHFVAQIIDITAQHIADISLRKSANLLARTGAVAGVGGWELDLTDGHVTWSDETFRLMDLEPGVAPGLGQALDFYAPDSRPIIEKAVQDGMTFGRSWDLELELISAKGRTFWARATGTPEFEGERVVRLVGAFQDITVRRHTERALAESYELIKVTMESIGDAVITTDSGGHVVWLNPVAETMTGWTRDDALGRPLDEVFRIIHAETGQPGLSPIAACLEQGKTVGLAHHSVLIARDGREFGIEDSAAPIRNADGHILGAVLVFHDVSEQRRLSSEMSHRASHDALTGLVNRAEFDARLSRLIDRTDADGAVHVLMYIDLDAFKIVNDACGHAAGDQLLKQVSQMIHGCVRNRDTVARLGGDEFGIIMERCSLDHGKAVAQKICDQMESYRFGHDGHRYRVGTSIGVVLIDSAWKTPAAVLQAADSCCYAAKEAGRNRVQVWIETDGTLQARGQEMQWVTRLEAAMDENRFRLYAQRIEPIGKPGGALHLEVLLRLVESDGSLVMPGAFLPAAERFHLASRIDRWVLRHLFEQLEGAGDLSTRVDMIAVNVSGQSVGDRAFHRDALRMIAEAEFDVGKLCIEITETAAITNLGDALVFIEAVRKLGVSVALDDFGAGASSFGYLRTLPVDYLKIDGKYITGFLDDPLDQAAVRCFCEVARVLGVKTIAEFVERPETRDALQRIGVDLAQGYLIHTPEPLERLMDFGRWRSPPARSPAGLRPASGRRRRPPTA